MHAWQRTHHSAGIRYALDATTSAAYARGDTVTKKTAKKFEPLAIATALTWAGHPDILAMQLGVTVKTVRNWSQNDRWPVKRQIAARKLYEGKS
jgi:DNA-binding transcriptional regulator YiaG